MFKNEITGLIYIFTHVRTCLNACVHTCMHPCMYARTQTHTHRHTHSSIHTYKQIPIREEISSAVSYIKTEKACGHDGIVAEHLLLADTQSSVQLLETVFKNVYEAEE